MKNIIVYCGSSKGNNPVYIKEAIALGKYLASNNYTMVYGAGSVGLMGVIADEMLKYNTDVIGVIPEFLKAWEVDHKGINQTIVTKTMHERKQKMAELGDAVIALPGGFGTFDELFEMLTWAQLGLHSLPIGLLNVKGFYDPLVQMTENMVNEGFLRSENKEILQVANDIDTLFEKLKNYTTKIDEKGKWLGRA